MSIMVDSKKRGPDVRSAVEPSVKSNGLSWYDTVNKVTKFWKSATSSWVPLSGLTLTVLS